MSHNRVLVAGATGTNGKELISQLTAAGVPVRALVRNAKRVAGLPNELVELFEGDLSDKESLAPAFDNIDKAYIATAIHPDAVSHFDNFFDTAKKARIAHVIKLSGLGADVRSQSEVLRQHGQADQLLQESGLDYTIIRPNSFYQNMFWQARQIRLRSKFSLPLGDACQSLIDVRDIAAATVKVITTDSDKNRVYNLTGPEALSFFGVASILSAAAGHEIKYVPISAHQSEQGMRAAGLSEWKARALMEIQEAFATGAYADTTEEIGILLDRRPRHFSEFAADYSSQF